MVDRDEWQFVRNRDPFGKLAANDQPPDQARTRGRHHTAEFGELQPRSSHYASYLPRKVREVRTRGYLRHHPAIRRMLALLA